MPLLPADQYSTNGRNEKEMNDASYVVEPTVMHTAHRSLFLELPTEVRENILRYLLVASYTAKEHDMRSKEYDGNRRMIQKGPDQTYRFDTAIMRTNRRIYQESVNLCQRENSFVCLTSTQSSRLAQQLEELGMQTLVRGRRAHDFWNIGMTITIDFKRYEGQPYDWQGDAEDQRPWKYILCAEELPTFCRLLLKVGLQSNMLRAWGHETRLLQTTAIHVDVNASWNGCSREMDHTAAGLKRVQKLLDPLRQLHSFGAAQVEGPLSASYKCSMITSVCKAGPTAMDIMHSAEVMFNQGDEHVLKGRATHALRIYKLALCNVRSCCWLYEERDHIMTDGQFHSLKAVQALHNLKIRLIARVATVYLDSGMVRMARIYVERALDPRRPYDDRHNKIYCLELLPWQRKVYAEVLKVSARIWYSYGHWDQAIEDLSQAGEDLPLNEEEQSRLEAWQKHLDSVRERNYNRTNNLRQKARMRFEERFSVACNRKRKGDLLLRSGRSRLAISAYMTALTKLDSLDATLEGKLYRKKLRSGQYQGYCSTDGIKALKFRLQASIAASYLKSQDFKALIRWASHVLACKHGRGSDCPHEYWSRSLDWLEDHRMDYAKIHFSFSLGLMHMGETVRAVEQMEKALEFDPGDGTAFAKLMELKGRVEKEKVAKRSI